MRTHTHEFSLNQVPAVQTFASIDNANLVIDALSSDFSGTETEFQLLSGVDTTPLSGPPLPFSSEMAETEFEASFPRATNLEKQTAGELAEELNVEDLFSDTQDSAIKGIINHLDEIYSQLGVLSTDFNPQVASVPIKNLRLLDEPDYKLLMEDSGFLALSRSVLTNGIQQPLIIGPNNQIINGTRRYIIAKQHRAETDELPCIQVNVPEVELPFYRYQTNIQRKLSYIEKAEYVEYLFEFYRSAAHYTFGGGGNNNRLAAKHSGLTSDEVNKLRRLYKTDVRLLKLIDNGRLKLYTAYQISHMPGNIRNEMILAAYSSKLTPKIIGEVFDACKNHAPLAATYRNRKEDGEVLDFFRVNKNADKSQEVPKVKAAHAPSEVEQPFQCPNCATWHQVKVKVPKQK